MYKFHIKIFICIILFLFLSTLCAYSGYVKGYYKKNGTYVQGHYRSNSNNTVRDNYSYKGNTNPYTGKTGNNKYKNNPTSEYYNGYKSNPNSKSKTKSSNKTKLKNSLYNY